MNLQDKCPICNSKSIRIIFQDKVIGNGHNEGQIRTKYFFSPVIYNNPIIKKFLKRTYNLDIRQCNVCDHLFQYIIFNPYEELEFHQSYFKLTGIDNGFKINPYKEELLYIKELNFLFSNFNIKNILDIGSSTGEFCQIAKKYNINPSGVDLCLVSNNFLKEKNIECFESVDEIDKTFDIIRVSHVLSHIHNGIESFIKSLILKLKVGGIIYFIDHLNNKTISPILSPLLHVNLFSDKSFNLLINKVSSLKLIKDLHDIYDETNLFKIYRRSK